MIENTNKFFTIEELNQIDMLSTVAVNLDVSKYSAITEAGLYSNALFDLLQTNREYKNLKKVYEDLTYRFGYEQIFCTLIGLKLYEKKFHVDGIGNEDEIISYNKLVKKYQRILSFHTNTTKQNSNEDKSL